MRDYPFNYIELSKFSNSLPYGGFDHQLNTLFEQLEIQKNQLNFPAINNDIGSLISMMCGIARPKVIFEMGSGYGQSAFWFLNGSTSIEKIILTEKRSDLIDVFHALPWPSEWREKISYYNDDAFKIIEQFQSIDIALIDGVKADYKKFLVILESRMKTNSLVFIDNSYWRGSFLNSEQVKNKQSARNIYELHQYIKESKAWESCFVPYIDGLSILKKK